MVEKRSESAFEVIERNLNSWTCMLVLRQNLKAVTILALREDRSQAVSNLGDRCKDGSTGKAG
jgi:hypothetical protein